MRSAPREAAPTSSSAILFRELLTQHDGVQLIAHVFGVVLDVVDQVVVMRQGKAYSLGRWIGR
jgi:ABC-type branched-subunit amino acid transport system ATPase component